MKLRVTNPDGSLVFVDVSIQTLVVMMMVGGIDVGHINTVRATTALPIKIEVHTPGGIFTETLERDDDDDDEQGTTIS